MSPPEETAPPAPGLSGRARALRDGLARLWPGAAPLELRMLGRTLLHAALVGSLAGALGAAFFAALEVTQRWVLEGLTGYAPLRAHGETFLHERAPGALRPWMLVLVPALGGLASGLLSAFLAPETAGGGGDAIIESYHRGGVVRRRVLLVKGVAALCTLGSGGSGGREGPTMQIGGAIGALVGRYLPTSRRERRVLLVAGIAAGIAAVFRTPLGAALLATEMLYRDDFEADALVPAILASVIAYSIVISIFGETTLFGHLHRFAFVPALLPLYVLLALAVALGAVLFIVLLRATQRAAGRLPVPVWARPALGGLAMGAVGTAFVLVAGRHGLQVGLGVFGGGYGVAQATLSGAPGLPGGWALVAIFALLLVAKMVASALTIGSGAAAGDFAPSLVMGALLGGAFGHAAALVLHDPRVDPAAFALVGMGTFYGGVAHAPLSALVLVSELAGSYDLLVPMMLAVSVAFVALRRWTLYAAQPASRAASPEARADAPPGLGALEGVRARDLLVAPELAPVAESTTVRELLRVAAGAERQRVLVVHDAAGAPRGLVEIARVQLLAPDELGWANAHDAMTPFAAVPPEAQLPEVATQLALHGLPQLPVVERGVVVGLVGETELARAYARVSPGGAAG